MPITVGDFRFRGPYSSLAMLEPRPGVWAVLDGRSVPPVAVGAAEDVRSAVQNHPARTCWMRRCERPAVAVFYSPSRARREHLLEKMRTEYELPCLEHGATLPAPGVDEGALPSLRRREGEAAGRVA